MHDHHVARFRRLFWVMLALAVPTVLASGMFAMIVGYRAPDVPWLSPVLGTVMYAWDTDARCGMRKRARSSVTRSCVAVELHGARQLLRAAMRPVCRTRQSRAADDVWASSSRIPSARAGSAATSPKTSFSLPNRMRVWC